MGAVYEAFDREREETVALKTLTRFDAESVLRFKNEFRTLHDFDHPNLVSLYELFEEDGEWFFTMELVDGVDFLSYVRAGRHAARVTESQETDNRGPATTGETFDEARLRPALAQLVRGLSALHDEDQVHRDVKPSNILVTPAGRVVLLDFGLITSAARGGHPDGLVGTVSYAAPEQALGDKISASADWYSVGVVLYEALTARMPHRGRTSLQLVLNKQQAPEVAPDLWITDVAPDLAQLCSQLLDPEPDERPTGQEVLRALDVGESLPKPEPRVFVGRASELTLLHQAFGRIELRDNDSGPRGAGPVVTLVEGASGLGKSELVRHFAARAVAQSPETLVLVGRCYERDAVAFKAFDGLIDELTEYLVRLPPSDAAALLPARADLLPRLFPVLLRVDAFATLEDQAEPTDPQELRRTVYGALRELFARVGERVPLVLIIDDLQWTDRDSLVLLQEVLGDAHAPELMLVGTLRPQRGRPRDRLLRALRRTDLQTIELGPLPDREAETLAMTLMPSADATVVQAVVEEAAGFPLFILELVKHVEGAGAGQGARRVDLDDALWRRISQLPGDQLPALQIVCTVNARITQALAAEAAGISPQGFFNAVTSLRTSKLVRTTGARRMAFIEPYHDRIRRTVAGHMSHQRSQDCHRRLAAALARNGAAHSAPHALVDHTLSAGDPDGAARHAETAARSALKATAFGRAVDFFSMALELGDHEEEARRALRLDLASALLNAGRNSEAADAFDAAAEGADPATRQTCQRLAAEQLLISGHIDRGLEHLDEALAGVGESQLQTPRRALFAVLWRRFGLRLRGLDWDERPASETSPEERARLQIVGAAALGLSMVDSIRGAAFNARYVQLALRSGDPVEVARALGTEATMAAYRGKYEHSEAIVETLTTLESSHPNNPYIGAWATIARGGYAYFRGDFETSETEMRRVGDLLSRVGGSTWERNNTSMFVLFCLRYRGDLRGLDAAVESLRRDAQRRGDLYMETSVRRYGSRFGLLVRDRPDDALADLEDTEWPAPENVFHLQDWQRLEAASEIALYAGRSADTRESAREGFGELKRSMLLRIATVRNPATFLRARLLLATPEGVTDLNLVDKLASQLYKEEQGYVSAWAHLLWAGSEHQRGRAERAQDHLRAALKIAEKSAMRYHVAVTQDRLGKLVGGEEGAALLAASAHWMTEQGVLAPERMCRVLAPGWGLTEGRRDRTRARRRGQVA